MGKNHKKPLFCFNGNKKGALQLSIDAVVILILAITMLGLGLAFIKGLFGGTVEKLKGIEKQLGEEERKELLSSADKITFLTSRIELEGRTKDINFAVRNINQYDIDFFILSSLAETGVDMEKFSGRDSTIECFDAIGVEEKELIKDWISFETYETRLVESGRADVVPLRIKVNPSATSTIYSCELDLIVKGAPEAPTPQEVEGTVYAKKRFEIEYKKG